MGLLDRKPTTKPPTSNVFSLFSFQSSDSTPRSTAPLPTVTPSGSSGDFFIRMSLDLLSASKEFRRHDALKTAIPAALAALDHQSSSPLLVFKPFQIACQSLSPELQTIAIDCLGKLFTYNYWKFADGLKLDHTTAIKDDEQDGDNDGTKEMITFVIDTVCESFSGESTDERVELQIIKALQAALTNSDPAYSLHGAILLKAIRTTYNIFLLSKSNDVQTVAQGTVMQMVQNVLSRIPNPVKKKSDGSTGNISAASSGHSSSVFSAIGVVAQLATVHVAPNISSPLAATAETPAITISPQEPENTYAREFKDAFKVIRILCVLSIKSLAVPDGSQPIRSKLLALYVLSAVINSHSYVFSMPARSLWDLVKEKSGTVENFKFMDAVKDFICLSLSRNATSMILPIFEVSLELFGRIWTGCRALLKKEMAIFFTEILLPVLEGRKNIPWYQRHSLMKALFKIFNCSEGGQMLVELYVNYDCDVEATAKENLWERLMNALAKVTTQHVDPAAPSIPLIRCFLNDGHETPALTTNNLVLLTREQVKDLLSINGDAGELRKQGVALMGVGVLKSLMDWCSDKSVPNKDSKNHQDESSNITEEESSPSKIFADDPRAIGNLKLKKQQLIEGIKRFNAKPKKFLLESGCISGNSPEEIAKFLFDFDGTLNKAMIGEYLGEGDDENIKIMHAFVDNFEFIDERFVEALRSFLQSFRLPGESQKIDRFMLKFAEKYLTGNPDTFSSADTAYVLAYSVIMLNTDQHNSQVKKRMTKQDFLKNNRGIDGGNDLPAELLGGIFDEISNNEIIMKDEQPLKKVLSGSKDNLVLKSSLAHTSENMALKTEQGLLRGRNTTKKGSDEKLSPFIYATHHDHVKPMFELIWMSVLTGLSTPLQECEDVQTVMHCLEGVRNAIRIACTFDMKLEKNALLSTLSKFTLLNNIQEMKEKNFEAIRTLLEIAYYEGGHLETSWKDVVSCISQLEKLQLIGDRPTDPRKRDASAKPGQKASAFMGEAAVVASSQSMALSIDRIFTSSANLSGAAIVDFVTALCEVSWDEISSSLDAEQPRMYSLQRLVEISYYNMKRIRVEWANIWAILGNHFNQVGCYPNTNVALFALDKLRQLTTKFLELEELANFKFQKDFLRPFEEIVKNNPDPKIKDMCLVCLQQIIQVKGHSLKSGWKTLSATLMRVAREVNEPIVNLAFEIAKSMMKHNFESIVINTALSDYVACLVEFCKNRKNPKINLLAVELLKQCVQKIVDLSSIKAAENGAVTKVFNTPIATSSPISEIQAVSTMSKDGNRTKERSTTILKGSVAALRARSGTTNKAGGLSLNVEDDFCFRLWMPVLFGLFDVIMTGDLEVRTRALVCLFDSLNSHGLSFSPTFWEILSKGVLFPIFEDMKQTSSNSMALNSKFANKEDLSIWLSTTLIQALRQFVDLFTHFYETIGFMLQNMLELLKVCLLHENETLSRIGSTCMQQLLEKNAQKFDLISWDLVMELYEGLFADTEPNFLFFNYKDGDESLSTTFNFLKKPLGPPPDRKEFQKQISKCVLHLTVVQSLQDVLSTGHAEEIYKAIPANELMRAVNCFYSSYQLAHVFNESTDLRQALYKIGYMKQLPNLLKQETMSANAYLLFLMKIYSDTSDDSKELRIKTQDKLIPLSLDIMKQYNSYEGDAKQSRNISAWRPVVVRILLAFSKFDDEKFALHIQSFYPSAIKLLLSDMTQDVRVAVYNILVRAGKIFKLISPEDAVGEEAVVSSPPAVVSEEKVAGDSTL